MSQPLGQPVKLTFETFSDTARVTHADPTTATIYVRDPATGTVTPHVWPTGDLTKETTGKFSWTLPDNVSGLFLWRADSTGAVATSTRAGAVSVDEAFPPMLVGLDDVKTETNIDSNTSDDELATYIYAASAVLLNHPAYRVADVCQVAPHTEWHNAGSDTIILKHFPVTAVTSITEYTSGTSQVIAAEPLDGGTFTGYGWDYQDGTGANGLLVRTSGGTPTRWGGNRVKVVYTAGAASVPADVRLAVLALVDHLWEMQRGGAGAGEPPGYDAESSPGTFGQPYGPAYALPIRVKELLEPYRKAPAVA